MVIGLKGKFLKEYSMAEKKTARTNGNFKFLNFKFLICRKQAEFLEFQKTGQEIMGLNYNRFCLDIRKKYLSVNAEQTASEIMTSLLLEILKYIVVVHLMGLL